MACYRGLCTLCCRRALLPPGAASDQDIRGPGDELDGHSDGRSDPDEPQAVCNLASTSPIPRDMSIGGGLHDRYEISLPKLGEGSFAVVRKASCRGSRTQRAVKMLPKKGTRSLEELQNEVDIMRDMDYPLIAKLFECFEDSEYVHLVVELLTGGEMLDCVVESNAELTEEQVASMLRQVCGSLGYVHSKGITHRDVKPEHFIFEASGPLETTPLKLIDFGLSRRFLPGEVLKTAVGTVLYVAPEVLKCAYGPECDLWSCGVILYCLLSGSVPFDGATAKDVAKSVKKARYSFDSEPWERVSADAKDVVNRLLTKDPRGRASASEVLGHRWMTESGKDGCSKPLGRQVVEKLKAFVADNKRCRSLLQYHAGPPQ